MSISRLPLILSVAALIVTAAFYPVLVAQRHAREAFATAQATCRAVDDNLHWNYGAVDYPVDCRTLEPL